MTLSLLRGRDYYTNVDIVIGKLLMDLLECTLHWRNSFQYKTKNHFPHLRPIQNTFFLFNGILELDGLNP